MAQDGTGLPELPCTVQLEGAPAGLGGVERRDAAVHDAVALLAVVLAVAGVGERHHPVRTGERPVAIVDPHLHLADVPDLAHRERDADDGVDRLAGEETAELDAPRVPGARARELVQRRDDGALPCFDHEHDVAGGDGERLAHLAADELGDLRGALDEVEVAAAGLGEPREEHLVEVGADAEGRGGDAAAAHGRHARDDLVVVGEAGVGEAVGQQEAAADRVVAERPRDLVAARGPAAVEVRARALARSSGRAPRRRPSPRPWRASSGRPRRPCRRRPRRRSGPRATARECPGPRPRGPSRSCRPPWSRSGRGRTRG